MSRRQIKLGFEPEDRTIVMTLRVTPTEKAMLERVAREDKTTVGELLRTAMYTELLTRGDVEAFKIVGLATKARVTEKLRELGLIQMSEGLA